MDNITIGEIIKALGSITAIAVFFIAIFKWYKSNVTNRFKLIDEDISDLKKSLRNHQEEINESKEERLILLKGQLACLKGLHNDLNCNGPVTQGIADLENYLIKKSHE